MNTNLENNFSKLLETLKDCLQPKDGEPDNRPDCEQLLQKINEFSINKCVLTEDKTIYKDFIVFLGELNNCFLKKFFVYKTNFKSFIQFESIKLKIKENITTNYHSDEDKKMLLTTLSTLLALTESSNICELFISKYEMDLCFEILKVLAFLNIFFVNIVNFVNSMFHMYISNYPRFKFIYQFIPYLEVQRFDGY